MFNCLKTSIFFLLIALLFSISCIKKEKTKVAIMTKLEAGSIVGSSEINAAKLFLEDHNIDNIELVPIDDSWNPEKAVVAYYEIKKRGIGILITSHVSTCALAIKDHINKDKTFTLVTGATTDLLSDKDDYIFRNIQDVGKEQKSIAEYMTRKKFRKLLIIRDTDNYAYTDPAIKYFMNNYPDKNVTEITVSIKNLDIPALEQRLKKISFSTLYLLIGGYKSEAGLIAQLARKHNPDVPIIYTPWMKTPTLLDTAGTSLAGSIIPSHYPPHNTNPNVDRYMERFKKQFNYPPTFISLNVYSALQIVSQAINDGHTKPDEIKKFILEKKSFETEFGIITFNQYGDVESQLFFITDIPGEF
jgi:branched-chain amino acid transport system substrate-binding protein